MKKTDILRGITSRILGHLFLVFAWISSMGINPTGSTLTPYQDKSLKASFINEEIFEAPSHCYCKVRCLMEPTCTAVTIMSSPTDPVNCYFSDSISPSRGLVSDDSTVTFIKPMSIVNTQAPAVTYSTTKVTPTTTPANTTVNSGPNTTLTTPKTTNSTPATTTAIPTTTTTTKTDIQSTTDTTPKTPPITTATPPKTITSTKTPFVPAPATIPPTSTTILTIPTTISITPTTTTSTPTTTTPATSTTTPATTATTTVTTTTPVTSTTTPTTTSTTPTTTTTTPTTTTTTSTTTSTTSTTTTQAPDCTAASVEVENVGSLCFVSQHKTWSDASWYCKSISTRLWVAQSVDEFIALTLFLPNSGLGKDFWVGVRNRGWSATEAGEFISRKVDDMEWWIVPVAGSSWLCGAMDDKSAYKLKEVNCDNKMGFICQM